MKLQRRLLRKRKRIPSRSECHSLFEIVLIMMISFAIDNMLDGMRWGGRSGETEESGKWMRLVVIMRLYGWIVVG